MEKEQGRWNSEQANCVKELRGFFGRMEKSSPSGIGELANIVGGLLGNGEITREKLMENLGNETKVTLGLKTLSAWMDEVGGRVKKRTGVDLHGFAPVGFLERKSLLAGAKILGIEFPSLDGIQGNTAKILEMFSDTLGRAMKAGLPARTIVAELVRDSITRELTLDEQREGSEVLRDILFRATHGHTVRIREALGIGEKNGAGVSVAVTKAGRTDTVTVDVPAGSTVTRVSVDVPGREAEVGKVEEEFVSERQKRLRDLARRWKSANESRFRMNDEFDSKKKFNSAHVRSAQEITEYKRHEETNKNVESVFYDIYARLFEKMFGALNEDTYKLPDSVIQPEF